MAKNAKNEEQEKHSALRRRVFPQVIRLLPVGIAKAHQRPGSPASVATVPWNRCSPSLLSGLLLLARIDYYRLCDQIVDTLPPFVQEHC